MCDEGFFGFVWVFIVSVSLLLSEKVFSIVMGRLKMSKT